MPHSAAGTKTQLLHFDSIYSTYLTDSNSATGNVSTPYRSQFFMNQTFHRIKRVSLKSVEIPVGFSNIRTGSTATLSRGVNGTAYSVQLAEKNYSTIAFLIADLNTVCVTLVSGVTIVFGLTTSLTTPLRLKITLTGAASFSIIDTNLSQYILGFRAARDSLVGGVYAASTSNYNLSADTYILMYIPTLNGMNASMTGRHSRSPLTALLARSITTSRALVSPRRRRPRPQYGAHQHRCLRSRPLRYQPVA